MEFTGHFGREINGYEATSQFLQRQLLPLTPAGQGFPRAPQTPPTSVVPNDEKNLTKLECSIFEHPDLQHHFKTVRTYLSLDPWVLEPISYLRQEGFFQTSIAEFDPSVRLPQRRQITDLASVQRSLFESPPTELFNLICQYRQRSGFRNTGVVQRLDKLKESWSHARLKPEAAGKTAPEGQVYKCPSVNCKKSFRKAGHATNHMEQYHPEYLQLYPDYQPQHFTVEAGRSASTSPELDRRSISDTQSESTPSTRHSATRSRPVSGQYKQAPAISPDVSQHMKSITPSPVAFSHLDNLEMDARHVSYQSRPPLGTTIVSGKRHASFETQYKRSRDVFASTESLAETNVRQQTSRHNDTRRHVLRPALSSWPSG